MCFRNVRKRKNKYNGITRRKSRTVFLRSFQYYFYNSYYGTRLCLLEWCGGAVRDFQAKKIRAGGGRSSDLLPCDLGPYLI